MVLYIANGRDQAGKLTDKFIIASCNELTNGDILNELNEYYRYTLRKINHVGVEKIGLTPRNLAVFPSSGRNLYLVVFSDGDAPAHLVTRADTSMNAMDIIERVYIKENRIDGYKVIKVSRLLNIEDIIISTK